MTWGGGTLTCPQGEEPRWGPEAAAWRAQGLGRGAGPAVRGTRRPSGVWAPHHVAARGGQGCSLLLPGSRRLPHGCRECEPGLDRWMRTWLWALDSQPVSPNLIPDPTPPRCQGWLPAAGSHRRPRVAGPKCGCGNKGGRGPGSGGSRPGRATCGQCRPAVGWAGRGGVATPLSQTLAGVGNPVLPESLPKEGFALVQRKPAGAPAQDNLGTILDLGSTCLVHSECCRVCFPGLEL